MTNSLMNYNTQVTPQSEPARDEQVKNGAGGFVFEVSDKDRLERFLILGTDGGTYYVSERSHVSDNIKTVKELIAKDEEMVARTTIAVSDEGRAYKNSPAIFVAAMLYVHGKDKALAKETFRKVVRTATHLFEFAQYIENFGGWGRAKKSAVADWYTNRSDASLATQVVKYRSRTV